MVYPDKPWSPPPDYLLKCGSGEDKHDKPLRILQIREMISETHWQCIAPFMGGRGGFGETFCGHIHRLNMTFKDQAEHYGITLSELADVTADHILGYKDPRYGKSDNRRSGQWKQITKTESVL